LATASHTPTLVNLFVPYQLKFTKLDNLVKWTAMQLAPDCIGFQIVSADMTPHRICDETPVHLAISFGFSY
jgi:hypothetical protein